MSQKFPGGFITKSPVAPTTTAASGVWTLDQQQQYQKAGTWPSPPIFIEDLFSTYLYTGTGASTFPVPNGIDLAGKGGLVWFKERSGTFGHILTDSARGIDKYLASQTTAAQITNANYITAFNSDGYTAGVNENEAGKTFVSWTFAKQPKFFDVVTYTGTGSVQNIAHNLGSVPGCIIIKNYTSGGGENWNVYHKSLGNTSRLFLDLTNAAQTGVTGVWNSTTPTDTVFTVGTNNQVNTAGSSNIAYLFADNAGGFPASGTGSENGITCGSFTTDGSGNATIDLGYEPQWVLIKATQVASDWIIIDNMRGWTTDGSDKYLMPQASNAELSYDFGSITSTGFTNKDTVGLNKTGIYIAIRRGPMKVPTSGTSVFAPIYATASSGTSRTIGFTADLTFSSIPSFSDLRQMNDRLRGYSNSASSSTVPTLLTSSTAAEAGSTATVYNVWNTTVLDGNYANSFANIWYHFGRAPNFFDEVCYTGTGSARTQTHNLQVVPELIIVKVRNDAESWQVYSAETGNTKCISLNNSNAAVVLNNWNNTTPTASVFSLGVFNAVNGSGLNYVAYLFATLAGVSKVGSYTGTGALQTVNCGFTSGARFVLIKRTDSTGDWYTYDSARGITSSNDPYLLLNSTAAEVTGTNYVDTDTTGFQVTAAAPAGLNANGGTYIFLAIA